MQLNSKNIYGDAVTSFCCILLTFLDIFGKVVCPAYDVNWRPLVVGIVSLEAIPLGHCMCFREILLMFRECTLQPLKLFRRQFVVVLALPTVRICGIWVRSWVIHTQWWIVQGRARMHLWTICAPASTLSMHAQAAEAAATTWDN